MKLSIVIPTYNQGPYIDDCLRSIQKQSFFDYEVIIQDSVSTDETQRICESYVANDSRFRYFREKDEGQSDAINRGLARSTGKLWTWICSDDYYADEQTFEVLLTRFDAAFKLSPLVVGVFGDAQYVSEKGDLMGPYYNATQDLTRSDFKLNWPLSQPSSFLLRELVTQVGGVDKQLYLGMDLDLFLKVLTGKQQFKYVAHMVVNIRVQPNSKSVKYRKKTAENALMIIKKHFGNLEDLKGSAYFNEYKASQKAAIAGKVWALVPFPHLARGALHKTRKSWIGQGVTFILFGPLKKSISGILGFALRLKK